MKPMYLKPSFVVCLIVLLAAAASKEAVIRMFGLHMTKQPIALQRSFDELNEKALLPYRVIKKDKIQNRDQLESLGTEDYLQWKLEDTEAAADSPTRYCSVFITYYTGNPDMVPHVPDECYVGGGNVHLSSDTLELEIPHPSQPRKLALQYAVFGRTDNLMRETKFSVQYLFHTNGQYCGSRTDTRLTLGSNWRSKYSYFSKVEWFFYGAADADKSQTLEASRKLLTVLLPELERSHWPNWEAVNAAEQEK